MKNSDGDPCINAPPLVCICHCQSCGDTVSQRVGQPVLGLFPAGLFPAVFSPIGIFHASTFPARSYPS